MPQVLELVKPRLIEQAQSAMGLNEASIAVVTTPTAGSPEVAFFVFVQSPIFLRGEEHPSLVRVWDNDDDAIFDTL